MPYQNESPSYKAINRIAKNEKIKELYGRCKISKPEDAIPEANALAQEIPKTDWSPQLVLAIDGSAQPEQIDNGYPGAEVGYVTAAAVIIKTAELAELDKKRPIDPRLYKNIETAQPVDSGLPGTNVILDDCVSSKHSFRKALFESLRDKRLDEDTETLLETYQALQQHRKSKSDQLCPYLGDGQCSGAEEEKYFRGADTYGCKCSLARELYSTDALRIHENMTSDTGNDQLYTETMQVMERLLLVNILRKFEQSNWLDLLSRVAIIIDGPLAVFGHPAWLKDCIQLEIRRINALVKNKTGKDLLLIGIEKTGPFVDHLNRLDTRNGGRLGALTSQKPILLTDEYIKKRIIFRDSDKRYGSATYFGRKWFYKTKQGALLVCSLPFLDKKQEQTETAEPDQFPRLADALNTLDLLWSRRYPNAITPIISAHAEATIPLNMGQKILKELAKEQIQGEKNA